MATDNLSVPAMDGLPAGTVTFLFTDVEGSTKLWEEHPDAMRATLARHDELMRQAIVGHNGVVFKTVGDAFCAAFATASDAVTASFRCQLLLHTEAWEAPGPLRVRMALHTGEAHQRDSDYFGPTLNRVARLLATACGQQVVLSLTTYQLIRDSLPPDVTLKELGSHRLKDLQRPEQVYQLVHSALRADFPPLKSLNNPALPNNLPQQLTSFIGREKEMADVKTLLARTRLLTLTGAGGFGKTRLSLQVAADLLAEDADGVWIVEIAPLSEPAQLLLAVAGVFGIVEETGKPLLQRVVDYLKPRHLLLILDNCEHMVETCARLADTLLKGCPHVQILASSREALNIAGEQTYRMPPLSLPRTTQGATAASLSQYEAVRLFVERALSVQPTFAVTNHNAPFVAQLCVHLDGIPLAIELAAARVRSLSVEDITARLDNVFRLLTGGSRTALPRQQTLRALIDWSYDLLSAPEQTLLGRLSVFAGGWELAASEQVCADDDVEAWEMLDLLTGLVDKSLIVYTTREDRAHYKLLETIRQYGHDRLREQGAEAAICARHLEYFLGAAEQTSPLLAGADQQTWLAHIEQEHDNYRAALAWALTHQPESALRLAIALGQFWFLTGRLSEGREQLAQCLSACPPNDAAPNDLTPGNPMPATRLPGAGTAEALPSDALPPDDLTTLRARALREIGRLMVEQGDYEPARQALEECLPVFEARGDKRRAAVVFNSLGVIAMRENRFADVGALCGASLALHREIENRQGVISTLNNLALLACEQGKYDEARPLYEESLALCRAGGEPRSLITVLGNLGDVLHEQGDNEAARILIEESLAIGQALEDTWYQAYSLLGLAVIAQEEGEHEQARGLAEQCLAMVREIGDRFEIASALHLLGEAACSLAEYDRAQALLEESLDAYHQMGNKKGVAHLLESFAGLCFARQPPAAQEAAPSQTLATIRLLAAADALRGEIGSPQSPVEQRIHEALLVRVKAEVSIEVFEQAWRDGQTWTREQSIQAALKTSGKSGTGSS